MCRSRNSVFLCALLVLIGVGPRVFAIDVSKTLEQAAKQPNTISSVFDGKAQVSNLYEKALHLAKQNEIVTTQQSLANIVAYYTRQLCKVTTKDVLNILYNSNQGFRSYFKHTVIDALTDGTAKPSSQDIAASYKRFFACQKQVYTNTTDYSSLEKEITDLYYQYLTNSFQLSTMDQSSFGEDLFRNGTLDDSDFDLLIDINALGTTFFSVFTATPEILFYRLPQSVGGIGGMGGEIGGGMGNGNQGIGDQGTGNGNSGTIGGGTMGIGTQGISSRTTVENNNRLMSDALALTVGATAIGNTPKLDDPDVQQFLATTNPTSFSSPDLNFVVGDQCKTGAVVPVVASGRTAVVTTLSDEEYISGVVGFIQNANIEDVLNTKLYSDFLASYTAVNQSHTPHTPDTVADTIANTYAEQAFGVGSSTCEQSCLNLPLGEQMKCQLGCAKSCIQTCDGLALYDKALCVSDCACSLISGPLGSGWEGVENMFSVKFCKAPIEKKFFQRGEVVTSIQGILDAIQTLLDSLKTSGQTTKQQKPKEFLDSNIKLNLKDIFDFKINVAFKALFPQTSATAQARKQKTANTKLSNTLLNVSADSSSENYNKYVIVADIPRNKAALENYTSPAELEALVQQFTTAASAAQSSLANAVTIYQNDKITFLSEDITSFLNSHIVFRNQLLDMLGSVQSDATRLKNKIENSE